MGKIFLRGLIGIAPLAITIILIIWLFNKLEYLFGTPLLLILGPKWYFPGLGLLVAIVILFFVGLIINTWIIQHFYNWMEATLRKIPLVKTIYASVTDLMSFFHGAQRQEKGKVVRVRLNGVHMLGIIMRETFEDLPKGFTHDDEVAVFVPFSYQLGGFTALVPRSALEPVDLTVERGIRFVVTAANPSALKSTLTPLKKKKVKEDEKAP